MHNFESDERDQSCDGGFTYAVVLVGVAPCPVLVCFLIVAWMCAGLQLWPGELWVGGCGFRWLLFGCLVLCFCVRMPPVVNAFVGF